MVRDLSLEHGPVSDLFPSPKTGSDWDAFKLTTTQIEFFQDKGYVAGVRLLQEKQLEVLRNELDEIQDPTHPGNDLFYEFNTDESADSKTVLFHALGAWRVKPGLHDLLWNPAFLMPASQLLGGAVRFWHDQIFYKPPRHGGVVAWHQDFSYWTRTTPLCHLTCWVGLDDATADSGCLYYVPGSHKWDLLPITGLAGDMDAIYGVLTEEQRKAFNPIPVELKAGECSFHHGMTVHGSFENRSSNPRRGVVINVARDGFKSASSKPLLEGVPVVPDGERIAGRFFPLLFSGVDL